MRLRSVKGVNTVEIVKEEWAESESEETTEEKIEQCLAFKNQTSDGIEKERINVDLLRILTEKLWNDSRNTVSIDSFAKIVPNSDGISILIRQWL